MTKQKNNQELLDLIGDEDPLKVLRELKEEEAYRLEYKKFEFYEPNGKCEEFIKAIGCGDYFIVFFSAANGVGKTAAGANVLANILFGSENKYFQDPIFKNWPFPKKGRIASDPSNISGVINSLKEWMPEGKYTTKKGGKSYDSQWEAGEWKFDIMTYEQDAKEFEGPTLGFAWFDEPPPESIFKATVARMRKGGIIFITATPLTGSAWMYDSLVTGNYEVDVEGAKIKRKIAHIEADVEAACKQHGVRGHLEHSNIEQMIAEYSEDEREARIKGKFQHLTGLIYKRFSRKIHVIKPFNINMREYVVYNFLDPHPRNPDAVMWVAVDQKGTKFVIDELYFKPYGTEELAQKIKNKDSQYRMIRWFGDPSMFIVNQHDTDGKSVADRLKNYGLNYLEATKMRAASNKRIEDALNYTEINGYMMKAPEVYIFETCQRTIYEIEHWRWDEWAGKNAEKHNKKEKPIDKDDHMIENLGRCLILEPVFIPMPAINEQQQEEASYDPYDQPMA